MPRALTFQRGRYKINTCTVDEMTAVMVVVRTFGRNHMIRTVGCPHGNVDQPVPTGEMNPSGISSNRGDLIQELAAKAWEGLAAQKEGDEMTADVQLPEAATTLSAGGGKGQGATQSHMPAAPGTEL